MYICNAANACDYLNFYCFIPYRPRVWVSKCDTYNFNQTCLLSLPFCDGKQTTSNKKHTHTHRHTHTHIHTYIQAHTEIHKYRHAHRKTKNHYNSIIFIWSYVIVWKQWIKYNVFVFISMLLCFFLFGNIRFKLH